MMLNWFSRFDVEYWDVFNVLMRRLDLRERHLVLLYQ